MSKSSLRSVHSLIKMAVKEAPIEQRFLQDLKASIEQTDAKNARTPSQTYKPSSLHCVRNMYFQVTGAPVDEERTGYCLIGIGESGTDRHERLQNAVNTMKDNGIDCEYIDVAEYVQEHNLDYLEIKGKSGVETKLYHKDLNISFLCDGIIKYLGEYYIIEFKTETIYKWQSRQGVDENHYDQGTCYSMCLGIDKVLFIYENRDNCDKKAYMFEPTDEMKHGIVSKIELSDKHVATKTPPAKPLDVSKKACMYCAYKAECRKAGA